jgi:hypothetical protein
LNLKGEPISFKADHTGMNDEVWPAQTQVEYTFPGTEYTSDRSLKITWYDGGRVPSTSGSHIPSKIALPRQGSILIGETGTLVIPHVGAPKLYPEENYPDPLEALESLNHYHGFVDGCLTGEQPSDGFDYGGPLTESVLLGNIACRYRGEVLEWDAPAMQITNLTEANQWLTRDYRDPYLLPQLASV